MQVRGRDPLARQRGSQAGEGEERVGLVGAVVEGANVHVVVGGVVAGVRVVDVRGPRRGEVRVHGDREHPRRVVQPHRVHAHPQRRPAAGGDKAVGDGGRLDRPARARVHAGVAHVPAGNPGHHGARGAGELDRPVGGDARGQPARPQREDPRRRRGRRPQNQRLLEAAAHRRKHQVRSWQHSRVRRGGTGDIYPNGCRTSQPIGQVPLAWAETDRDQIRRAGGRRDVHGERVGRLVEPAVSPAPQCGLDRLPRAVRRAVVDRRGVHPAGVGAVRVAEQRRRRRRFRRDPPARQRVETAASVAETRPAGRRRGAAGVPPERRKLPGARAGPAAGAAPRPGRTRGYDVCLAPRGSRFLSGQRQRRRTAGQPGPHPRPRDAGGPRRRARRRNGHKHRHRDGGKHRHAVLRGPRGSV